MMAWACGGAADRWPGVRVEGRGLGEAQNCRGQWSVVSGQWVGGRGGYAGGGRGAVTEGGVAGGIAPHKGSRLRLTGFAAGLTHKLSGLIL